jgi:methylthioribose-1-phosphate isomerase
MKSIEWTGNMVRFIDQTLLPEKEEYVETTDLAVIEDAIRTLKVRGAPALGVAAAYGIVLGVRASGAKNFDDLKNSFDEVAGRIGATRPTARNLFWAIERLHALLMASAGEDIDAIKRLLLEEAIRIHNEDEKMCSMIGSIGAELVPMNAVILTHCNTGALATGGEGTAQSVITTASRRGKNVVVYADETRPLLQGARLTAWELMKNGINVTLITDNAAGFVMKKKKVTLVIVGADRIASNGDTANKIGTYSLALLAKEHRIPFYVAAPTSTFDRTIAGGEDIPIEERNSAEVVEISGKHIAPHGVPVYSPAFDITPANLISAIITERGILRAPYGESIQSAVGNNGAGNDSSD